MTSKYELKTNDNNETFLFRSDDDGKVWCIPTDPANSDYQDYLAHLTESVTKAK